MKLVVALKNVFLARGRVVGFGAFPMVVSGMYLLYVYLLSALSSGATDAVNNGFAGFVLGLFGSALLLGSALSTWESTKKLMVKKKA